MKIIKPSVEILTPIDKDFVYKHLESCGRVCYKSEDKTTETSAEDFLRRVIKRNHGAVLEHFSVTVKFICDRGITHEIVRHRIASFCQESTRYCRYDSGKFGNEITVIEPCYLTPGTPTYAYWQAACQAAEDYYLKMSEAGCSPQEARAVLPTSAKTELVMTANIREWRHFFQLRTSPAAHPQMIEVAKMLLEKFKEALPVLFEDINP